MVKMTKTKNNADAVENIPKNGSATIELTSNDHHGAKKSASIRKYIADLYILDFQAFIKVLRSKLGLAKSPKRKGYSKFFTDEEKRLEKFSD